MDLIHNLFIIYVRFRLDRSKNLNVPNFDISMSNLDMSNFLVITLKLHMFRPITLKLN